jgi:hypothetical protein
VDTLRHAAHTIVARYRAPSRAVVAAGAAALAIAWLPPAVAAPAAEPSTSTNPHAFAYATVRSVVRFYNRHGKLISTKAQDLGRVGSEPATRTLVSSGSDTVGPTSQGTGRDDVTYTGHGTLGEKLYSWTVWTKWSWDHLSCPCTMNMLAKGTVHQEFDKHWSYDRVESTNNHYDSGAGGPHTSYTHDATGQFEGPGIGKRLHRGIGTVYRRPEVLLISRNDGTDDWFQFIN